MKTTENFADITIHTRWKTEYSSHHNINHIQRLNIFRDFLYEHQPELLLDLEKGDLVKADKGMLADYFSYDNSKIIKISKRDIKALKMGDKPLNPQKGRFYPKGILAGISNVFSANMHPFRCLEKDDNYLFCDLNNPLAGKKPGVEVKIDNIIKKERDSGGSCRHIFEEIMSGPGMEARFNNRPTDFFSNSPFKRADQVSDEKFYEEPRITAHTDALCRKHLERIYSELIKPDSAVLDLMASVYSHLPEDNFLDVTGLGMNMEELEKNKILRRRFIQDINENTRLPFEDKSFDYVTCAMSVEYLVKPLEIFKEVSRVLKKGGLFMVSFSNRWFPGKEIGIWNELHDFEKMGLVSEYFLKTDSFINLNTKSITGFPRPYDKTDRYKDSLWFSDPLFVVYAEKKD